MPGTNVNIGQITVNVNDTIPPENFATVDKGTLVGNTYTKEQDNSWRKTVENTVKSGIIGVLKPNTPYDAINYPFPKPWVVGDADLYEKYDVNEDGNFPSTKDANGDAIDISAQDLLGNEVQIWIKNGVAEVNKKALPQASPNLRKWESLTANDFPLTDAQVVKGDSIFVLKNGQSASISDVPGVSEKWAFGVKWEDFEKIKDNMSISNLFEVKLNLQSGGAKTSSGNYYSNNDVSQSQLIKVSPGEEYIYYGAFGVDFGIVGFSNSSLANPTAIVTADFLNINGLLGNDGLEFKIPTGIEYIYYACWLNGSTKLKLTTKQETNDGYIGQPLLKGDTGIFSNNIGNATKSIGQAASNYKPAMSIFGGFIANSPDGEHQLINSGTQGYATQSSGVKGNVLSIKHTNPNGSSAVRFLRASDGSEVGACGYQNGDGSNNFILNNATFLSASTPYNGNNGSGTGQMPFENPPKLILAQEGIFENNSSDASARFLAEPNWNMGFYRPFNYTNPFIYMPANTGNVIIGSKTDNGNNRLQVNGSAANTTGVWNTLSDERLKSNISEIKNPIEKVKAIAGATRSYIKDGVKRTGYIAQLLLDAGFDGHITYNVPENEEIGKLFGWEYTDKVTHHKVPIFQIYDEHGNPIKKEVFDEHGNQLFNEYTEIERVVKKEGDKILGIENNFTPYLFAAFVELLERVEILENATSKK